MSASGAEVHPAGTAVVDESPRPNGIVQFQDEKFLMRFFKDQVLGQLMGQLVAMSPGDVLPSERALSEELNISRTALRDRMARLASMGIVSKRPREGTVYTGLHADSLGDFLLMGLLGSKFDIFTLVQMRKALETSAVVILTSRDQHPDLSRVADAIERIRTSTGSEIEVADRDFHLGLLAAAGLQGLFFFWSALDQVFRYTHDNIDYDNDIVKFREKHQRYFEAIQRRDLDEALRRVDDHFEWLIELLQVKGF